MLQPATKALAQMLAGRTAVSGQLEQARAVLGQAERLIAERVHNRLNPAEREEFFEQLARLRLTLADAADEAEARAAEQQRPPRPAAPPVAQERLKEMALALATPEGARRRAGSGGEDDGAEPQPTAAEVEAPASRPVTGTGRAPESLEAPEGEASEDAPPPPDGPRRLRAIPRPGRLELPRDAAATAAQSLSSVRIRTPARRRPLNAAAAPTPAPAASAAPAEPEPAVLRQTSQHPGNGTETDAGDKAKASRRSRKTKAGLPEGWIIDDEGFVVPGPG
jgi:hypothetical protein